MKEEKLPIVISVPHGGTAIPEELQEKLLLDEQAVLLDSDTWTRELFDFKDVAAAFIETDVSRLVVDLNREKGDLPPANPDGIVKTLSVDGQQVWADPEGLTPEEADQMIQAHYDPYHERVAEVSRTSGAILGIDGHSMLDIGPVKGTHLFEQRPLFCIGNRGSESGGFVNEPITAPVEMMQTLKRLLEEHFGDLIKEWIKDPGMTPFVTMNQPFSGGYMTRRHGTAGPIPWIQLEINRRLYLPQTQDGPLVMSEEQQARLKVIRDTLEKVFEALVEETATFPADGEEAIS
ncbi:N-formylglutamate amidohydrolase [Salisediminibacterium beveridgei]|uniref:N-formylglutamate deformylase n=1 Tax=Salisediminibacterium beveridgei TaxID=632773 RepID=A0A1D7QY64_9BACI|nr:N-formylglutamate amidohydrolase [Salisediminibacterium beveridgei]AOM83944.1 N-formylglutamate deformylase [Salisediminibacterium beveridgei]